MKLLNFQKVVAIALLVVLASAAGHSTSKLPFKLERISADYNGVAYNGRTIVAYGNYGLITYSTDLGNSWRQISLGDEMNILKIITLDTVFYGLTPFSILKSTDNGMNWLQKPLNLESALRDFAFGGNYFYLISENKIFRIDTSLEKQPELIQEFEFATLSEIVYLENHLFCIDSKYYIFKINLETNEVTTIDVHQGILQNTNFVRDISHLKAFGTNLYLLAENVQQNNPQYTQPEYADNNIRHYLLKTTDLGENWELVTSNIRLTKEYQVFNDTVYFLTQKGIRKAPGSGYFYTIRYFKIASNGEEEEINKEELLDRFIPIYMGSPLDVSVPSRFRVNMFIKIDDEKIVAVGPNKTILFSKNNGLNWQLVSYFKPIIESDLEVKALGNDTIIVLTDIRPYFFVSFDNGATFLPPKRLIENFPTGVKKLFAFDDGTFGFIRPYYDTVRFHLYLTKDLGNSFSKKVFYPKFSSTLYSNATLNNNLLLVLQYKIDSTSGYYFYFFDKSLNSVDSSYLEAANDLLLEDSIFFAISSNLLLQSKSFGKNWDIIYFPLNNRNFLKLHYKNYLFIPNLKMNGIRDEEWKLLILNLLSSTVDTLSTLPLPMRFFIYKDTAFAFSYISPNMLYFFTTGLDNKIYCDSVNVLELLSDDLASIYSIASNNFVSYFVLRQVAGSALLNTIYELNLAMISYSNPEYLPVEPTNNEDYTYLYAFPPYPNPSRDNVKIKIYWDSPSDDKSVYVDVFDPLGRKYKLETQFTYLTGNSAYVQINTTPLPLGVYYLQISYGSRKFVFPLSIMK
jgi:hypothetical protein